MVIALVPNYQTEKHGWIYEVLGDYIFFFFLFNLIMVKHWIGYALICFYLEYFYIKLRFKNNILNKYENFFDIKIISKFRFKMYINDKFSAWISLILLHIFIKS